MPNTIYEYEMPLNNGKNLPFSEFDNQVLLIVNTASKCGFTPQYDGLQALHDKYKDQGFQVLGFPCDQFGHQEPGSDADIEQFCTLTFNVNFPLFKKTEVNGDNTSALYTFLKNQAPGLLGSKSIKWNFTKFLINRKGEVIKRYAPNTKPKEIEQDIEALL